MYFSLRSRKFFLGIVTAGAVIGGLVGVGGAFAAMSSEETSSEVDESSIVENFGYPDTDEILEKQNVRLISGDGHILLVDCATPPEGDIGLLRVYTTKAPVGSKGRICFKVTATYGYLTLEVPAVYEIRGDGLKTGTGHKVTADLRADDGEEITVECDPDGSTQVGTGTGSDPNIPPTTLLRLTVNG